jgi:hypothetical protein
VGGDDDVDGRLRRRHASDRSGRIVGIVVMLVGIGFLSLLIGAVADRFVATGVQEEVADLGRDVEADVEAAEAELLRELRAMSARLGELEATVRRRRA